jgi:DNA replicative helicase MCM subunit Mcm2 (Cdc46/Mcm family)
MDTQDPFGLNNLMRHNIVSKEDSLLRLGRQADIYEKLTASLAPSIWSMDDVKKGILCQLFGATLKVCERLLATLPFFCLSQELGC